MANESSSQVRLGLYIFLFAMAIVGFVVATIATVALMRTRQELDRTQQAQNSANRWRIQTPPPPIQNQGANADVQRLTVENSVLRSQLAQIQAQLRAEASRSATPRYSSSSRSRLTSRPSSSTTDIPPRDKEDEERFLAENKTRTGVVTLPSGLQYRVIWPGYGRAPQSTDFVNLNYRGTLSDGTEIDSSYVRGDPVEFSMSSVMKGWKEALLLMPVGARWQIFIPAELAYGERGSPRQIPPNATLVYELELISIRDRNTPVASRSFGFSQDVEPP